MGAAKALYYASDNLLEVNALKDAESDTLITTATVSAEILNSAGATVAGSAISLSHSSGGNYSGNFSDTVAATLSIAARYTVKIVADGGAGLKREWLIPVYIEQGE